MRAFLFVTILLALIIAVVSKKKKSSSSSSSTSSTKSSTPAKTNVEILSTLVEANRALLTLTDRNFSKFITDRPREYKTILMLTATDPKYGCNTCVKSKNNLEEVAKMYNSQYNFSKVSAGERVVFFKVEVDDARSVFQELQLETVPRIFAVPNVDVKSPKVPLENLEVDGRAFLETLAASIEHVNTLTGTQVLLIHI
jgi:thioredoxin-like negative regulator of GroEL